MSYVKKAYEIIRNGRSTNRPPSIPSGFEKYDRDVYGIRQGQYILVGGESGTGKTPFIRSTFMYNVWDHYKRINDPAVFDVEFKDFSLEIPGEMNVLGAMSRRLALDTGQIIPIAELASWGNYRLSAEKEMLANKYGEYFEEFERKVETIDKDTTPHLFHKVLMDAALANGKFTKWDREIANCEGYIPNNPNKFIIVLVDTLNLADGTVTKTTMDACSWIAVKFRNKCNFTFVMVQQFNSDLSATDRGRYGVTTPVMKDFMDSTRPSKDCNVAIGLYAPYRHYRPDYTNFRGYDIVRLGTWLLSLHIMKNRYGPPNACVPLKFDGTVGLFSELPPPILMTDEEYVKATTH